MQTLAAVDICKSYRGRRVVNGVSLGVEQGEVVGLLGPNGAGKTTTFYAIVGLIPPDDGRILLNEEDITDVPMYRRARQFGISYLPQEASVFRKLTVEENILAVLEAQPVSWHERRETMEQLIDQLGLEHIRLNRGYALSGGERRRVEIARALCISPKFILLDEPFSRYRSADYGPQCTGDAVRNRPRLHHQRRQDFPAWYAGATGKRFGSKKSLFGTEFFAGVKRQWIVTTSH